VGAGADVLFQGSPRCRRAIKAAFEAQAKAAEEKKKQGAELRNKDRITAPMLNDVLIADKTAPWATYNKGQEISQAQVARLLKPYGIKPKTIRWDDGTKDGSFPKGYLFEWFADVFERFCTASSPGEADSTFHASTDLFSKENRVSTSSPGEPHVETRKPNENNGVDAWKPESGKPGEEGYVEVPSTLPEGRREELADWCRQREAEGEDLEDRKDALRTILREELVDPEQVEVALERVMALVRTG